MITPQFLGLDGIYRESYTFTTDIASRFFTGQMSADTVDMQVSIRGAAFTADPDLVVFEGTEFTIPNPAAYPDGLALNPGQNTVQVKSVLTTGDATSASTINAWLSQERDVREAVIPPSGIFVERKDATVTITLEGLSDTTVKGYNFYASVAPGGGTTGYFRINTKLAITSATEDVYDDIGEMTSDSYVKTSADGAHAADPLYVNVKGIQEDQDQTLLQTDFDQRLEVPETSSRLKTTITVQSVRRVRYFSFTHDRSATVNSASNPAIPNSEFTTIDAKDPLYYVVTAVYAIGTEEFESDFSPEVFGAPLVVTPSIGTMPVVSRQQVVRDTVLSIYRSQGKVSVKEGAYLRDTFIDPFATEAERIRFVVDFLHRAQSFATLLAIDDPAGTGESLPVYQSQYKLGIKQAFYLRNDDDVQALIDDAFEQLAAQRGATRDAGKRSRGEVTFYTTLQPSESRILNVGQVVKSGAVPFRITSPATITANGSGSFYNPSTGRYTSNAFLQAENPGSAGNVSAGQITVINNGPSGVYVTNSSATYGGRDQESNRDLAARADGLLSSVDSGTYRGYVQRAVGVAGVRQASVIDAGHALMMRDYVPSLGKHTGGKVDIWVRGESLATITDSFAFPFDIAKNIQFEVVGDVTGLRFRAIDPNLTEANPIIEMLDIYDFDYEFLNATTGQVMDLTGVTISGYNGIILSSSYNDPTSVHEADVFFGSYRYRTSDRQILTRQPVRAITSLVGSVTGTLSPTQYNVFHERSPLDRGRSTEAADYLLIDQATTTTPIPSSTPVTVTGEEHVILDGVEYLNRRGVNPLTVRIFSEDRVTEYINPYDPAVNAGTSPDYAFIQETQTTPLGIRVAAGSLLTDGQTVLIDYMHDENFTATYTSNAIVSMTQSVINESRHVTADVLIKEAVPVGVDIYATVVLRKGSSSSTVDSSIRTELAQMFGSMVLGEPLRQSDVIEALDSVDGVSYVVVPLTRLCKSDDSSVIRESVPVDQSPDYFPVTAWSTGLVDVFLLKNPLGSATKNSGGDINEFRGVFIDDVQLHHWDVMPNANGIPLNDVPDSAFIIGNLGMVVPGYSDDLTLSTLYPFATAEDIEDKRQELTANRVLVSRAKNTDPTKYSHTVTYIVYGNSGVRNIDIGPIEYLQLGDLDMSYDEDVDFTSLVTGRSN